MTDMIELFNIKGFHRPVAFINCQSLYPHLFTILRDWKITKLEGSDHQPPIITIRKTDAGFLRKSKWSSSTVTFSNPVDAACDLIVDLIRAYIGDNKGLLCLHCAAVEFNQGLVIFPNTYRAGKSLLSLKLVSCGGRLFTDDVLPITPGTGKAMALGVLPRLRQPLPEESGKALIDFVFQHTGPKNSHYLYVALNAHEQAALGTTASVRGIVILQRSVDAKPALMSTPKDRVVKDMILRNFARQEPALDIIDRIHAIVEQADCYTLRYATLNHAAALLADAFGLSPPDGTSCGFSPLKKTTTTGNDP